MAFAVEFIPDDARLFRKVHKTHFDKTTGIVSSAAFKQDRMSVNWEKYKTAQDSADENSSAIVEIIAKDCRKLNLTVEHTPIASDLVLEDNQAHAEVCGKKTGSISQKLRDAAKIVWLRP